MVRLGLCLPSNSSYGGGASLWFGQGARASRPSRSKPIGRMPMPHPNDLGCGRPARVVFRKTGETPVPLGFAAPVTPQPHPPRAGSGTRGHLHCVPVGPAVSNPREGSRSARKSDPTPGPEDKVPRRWALGLIPWGLVPSVIFGRAFAVCLRRDRPPATRCLPALPWACVLC